MPQLTPAQARIIDPVLTNLARGFRAPQYIAMELFPRVPVSTRAGRVVSFGYEEFLQYNTRRAPGAKTQRINIGWGSQLYSLEDHSLEAGVPVELEQEAIAVAPPVDMAMIAVRKALRAMQLRFEIQAAAIARNFATYGAGNRIPLSGTSQWSDFGTVSDPIQVIETAKEAVRQRVGVRPNTVVMGGQVFAFCRQHPKVVDRIKYTSRDIATPELLAMLFGVDRVLIGDAVQAADSTAADPTFSDVWGKDCIVAYTVPGSVADLGTPTYGYTYQLDGYLQVEEGYWDRNTKSWYYPVTDAAIPVIAAANAGYLIQNAVA